MNLDPCRRLSKSPPAGSRCRYGLHHADHRQPVSLVPRLKPSLVRWAISHGGDAAQRIIHADAINERSVIKLAAEPLPALWFGPRASETAPELRTPAWLLKWAVLGGPSDVEAMAHSRPLADCRHERVCSFVIDILGMSGAAQWERLRHTRGQDRIRRVAKASHRQAAPMPRTLCVARKGRNPGHLTWSVRVCNLAATST